MQLNARTEEPNCCSSYLTIFLADHRPCSSNSFRLEVVFSPISFLLLLCVYLAGASRPSSLLVFELVVCRVKVSSYIIAPYVSNVHDYSKRFTLHSPADMFNRTPSWHIWEIPSHGAIKARRLFVHRYPLLSTAR